MRALYDRLVILLYDTSFRMFSLPGWLLPLTSFMMGRDHLADVIDSDPRWQRQLPELHFTGFHQVVTTFPVISL